MGSGFPETVSRDGDGFPETAAAFLPSGLLDAPPASPRKRQGFFGQLGGQTSPSGPGASSAVCDQRSGVQRVDWSRHTICAVPSSWVAFLVRRYPTAASAAWTSGITALPAQLPGSSTAGNPSFPPHAKSRDLGQTLRIQAGRLRALRCCGTLRQARCGHPRH